MFASGEVETIRKLFKDNHTMQGGNVHLYQKLIEFRKESDYVKRNVGDLVIQLRTVQKENATSHYEIGKLL